MQVEKRLLDLSKEIDEAHKELTAAEQTYHVSKASYEITMARGRMEVSDMGVKINVATREDMALIKNSEAYMNLSIAEATVKAARANVQRIRTQVDIARSISVSVRASMDIV